jgi:FkbM family methyltransferase
MTSGLKEAIRGLLPRRQKTHRIHGGPLAGHRIHTSWHDYPGAIRGDTESPLVAWFARNVRPGETWLDVGAHYGYTAIALSWLVGTEGRVIAFEPVLATAGCLARTRGANRLSQLQIVPMGLSTEPGIVPALLPVHRGMADASLGAADWYEAILVTRFDGLWESLSGGNPAIHGVKIDVQGMEGSALAGMAGMLRRWHPKLVIEFHTGVDRGPILDLLDSCGYSRRPEPVEPDSSNAIENDKSYAFSVRFGPASGTLEPKWHPI